MSREGWRLEWAASAARLMRRCGIAPWMSAVFPAAGRKSVGNSCRDVDTASNSRVGFRHATVMSLRPRRQGHRGSAALESRVSVRSGIIIDGAAAVRRLVPHRRTNARRRIALAAARG